MGFKTGIVVGILIVLGWQNRSQIYQEFKNVHVQVSYGKHINEARNQ